MANPYPVSIAGAGDKVDVAGDLTFTDPDNQPVSALPHTREILANGAAATIADGANADLEFGAKAFGDTLLDLTSPTEPVVLVAGVYAISLDVASDTAMATGGVIVALLSIDAAGSPQIAGTGVATAANNHPKIPLTLVTYLTPGDAISVNAVNNDGTGANDIYIESASIQRIS